jgi:hypothetical protein
MFRHFCCLNRATLSTHRVKWPMTMASQMSLASSPLVTVKMLHTPSGTTTWETIEM